MEPPASPPPVSAPPGHLLVGVFTPEGPVYDGLAEAVIVPAHDGQVEFLPGHAPFVARLGAGELRIRPDGPAWQRWFLEGGVVQTFDGTVTVLAERAQPAARVDAAVAQQDLAAALARVPTTPEAFEARDRALASARARIRIANER